MSLAMHNISAVGRSFQTGPVELAEEHKGEKMQGRWDVTKAAEIPSFANLSFEDRFKIISEDLAKLFNKSWDRKDEIGRKLKNKIIDLKNDAAKSDAACNITMVALTEKKSELTSPENAQNSDATEHCELDKKLALPDKAAIGLQYKHQLLTRMQDGIFGSLAASNKLAGQAADSLSVKEISHIIDKIAQIEIPAVNVRIPFSSLLIEEMPNAIFKELARLFSNSTDQQEPRFKTDFKALKADFKVLYESDDDEVKLEILERFIKGGLFKIFNTAKGRSQGILMMIDSLNVQQQLIMYRKMYRLKEEEWGASFSNRHVKDQIPALEQAEGTYASNQTTGNPDRTTSPSPDFGLQPLSEADDVVGGASQPFPGCRTGAGIDIPRQPVADNPSMSDFFPVNTINRCHMPIRSEDSKRLRFNMLSRK